MSALNKWRRHLRGSEAAKSPPRKEGTFGFVDRNGPRAQRRVTLHRSNFRAGGASGCRQQQTRSSARSQNCAVFMKPRKQPRFQRQFLLLHTWQRLFIWITRKWMPKKRRQVQVFSRKERQVRTQLHRHEVDRERPDVLPLWYQMSGNLAPVGVDVADVCDELQTRAQVVLVPEPPSNLKDRFHLESH